jgi:hypothetical protein
VTEYFIYNPTFNVAFKWDKYDAIGGIYKQGQSVPEPMSLMRWMYVYQDRACFKITKIQWFDFVYYNIIPKNIVRTETKTLNDFNVVIPPKPPTIPHSVHRKLLRASK